MARAVIRKRKKSPCARHRDAQARYVRKNPKAQRERVAKHYRKNKDAVLARKKAQGKKKKKRGGQTGRPRTGCKES
jgi:hypothetical protein